MNNPLGDFPREFNLGISLSIQIGVFRSHPRLHFTKHSCDWKRIIWTCGGAGNASLQGHNSILAAEAAKHAYIGAVLYAKNLFPCQKWRNRKLYIYIYFLILDIIYYCNNNFIFLCSFTLMNSFLHFLIRIVNLFFFPLFKVYVLYIPVLYRWCRSSIK